jgi:hypothetical protein
VEQKMLCDNIAVPVEAIADLCQRHHIRRL